MEGDTRELLDLASAAVACEVGGGTAATEIVSVAVMRGVGPKLGDLHWREVTGMGQRCRVLPQEAMGMRETVRHAKRLREPGWEGDNGQGRWPVQRLREWAVKELELTLSRRGVKMELGSLEDWLQREQMERRMGDSLLNS